MVIIRDKDFALRASCAGERESGSHEQVKMMQLMINVVCVLESPEQLPYLGLGRNLPRRLSLDDLCSCYNILKACCLYQP